jgi:hypothetical protein
VLENESPLIRVRLLEERSVSTERFLSADIGNPTLVLPMAARFFRPVQTTDGTRCSSITREGLQPE